MVSKMAEDVVSREEFASVVQALTEQMETLGTPAAEASAEKPAQTAAAKKAAAAKAKAEPAATEEKGISSCSVNNPPQPWRLFQ